MVKWANEQVKEITIKNFKDKALADGNFLIKLCASIEPRAIDYAYVQKGDTEEERENNAKYVLTVARKLGCVIFCVWEDIPKVNYKMLLVLVCSLFDVSKGIKE